MEINLGLGSILPLKNVKGLHVELGTGCYNWTVYEIQDVRLPIIRSIYTKRVEERKKQNSIQQKSNRPI